MDKPSQNRGRPCGPIDPPEGHGPLGNRPDCPTRQPDRPGDPGERAADSPLLNRPCRSEDEAREGRRARAELDQKIIQLCSPVLILLSKDTTLGFGGAPYPGRFVVLESAPDNSADTRWLACWQNAQTAVLEFPIAHVTFACALDDIARRHRAGRLAFVSGYQR